MTESPKHDHNGDDSAPADDALLHRLASLRSGTERASAPDMLWTSLRAAAGVAVSPAGGGGPAVRRQPLRLLRYAAAAALLGVGVVVGRTSTTVWHTVPVADATRTESPVFAVQRSGTALVRALDALDAADADVPEAARAEHREVALAALGSIIATGAVEYPREFYTLIKSLPAPEWSDRPSATSSGLGPRGVR